VGHPQGKHRWVHLDPEFLRQLERVRFSPRWAITEREIGEHPSSRHGVSVEFADYREYQPGDDFRAIDWTLLARLDRLYVKLFRGEENLRLELQIDASTSMHFGHPTKLAYAIRLAAALGYVGLHRSHRVRAVFFGSQPYRLLPNARGRQAATSLFRFLAQGGDAGSTDINASLRQLALQSSSSVTVLISDLLDPAGYASGLDALLRSGRRVAIIHLLSPEELNPEVSGEFEWLDAETAQTVEISVDRDTLALYQDTLSEWFAEIRTFCETRRIPYFHVATNAPLPDVVLRHLRQGGLLA
jgi:uncharacterized protein (DUF58 family)